jgi:hypothetical protein
MWMGGYLTKGNPSVCLGRSGGWVSIPRAIPEESRVSAAPTALGVVVEGFPALPRWADVWAAGPPGLEAAVNRASFFLLAGKAVKWRGLRLLFEFSRRL